jgi:hypothetical protein
MKPKRFLFGKQNKLAAIQQDMLALGNKTVKAKGVEDPSKMTKEARMGEAANQRFYPDKLTSRRMKMREDKAKDLLFERKLKGLFGGRRI